MRHLLHELDCTKQEKTSLMEDNQGALVWSTEGLRHTKDVSIRYNFVKEQLGDGVINMIYRSTDRITANILTKPISRVAFEEHRCGLWVKLRYELG